MAGVGSLANANFHMYEPSPIETQLALADPVKNPRAVALLPGYQADREMAQNDYAGQLDWQRQQQLAEFQQKSQSDMRTQLAGILQHVATTPGGAQAARSAGLLPNSVDTSGQEQAADAAAAAKNFGETATGLGHLGQGNFQVGQTQLQQMLPGGSQGPNPMIAAAGIRAAGDGNAAAIRGAAAERAALAASQPHNTIKVELPGGVSLSLVSPRDGQPFDIPRALAEQGIQPGTMAYKMATMSLKTMGIGNGAPTAPPAPNNTPLKPAQTDAADAAPFINNTGLKPAPRPTGTALDGPIAPPTTPLPQPQAQTTPTATMGQDALNRFYASNPQGAADVAARAKANGNKIDYSIVGGKPMLIGASGQKYAVQ